MPIPMYEVGKLDGFYLFDAIRRRAQEAKLPWYVTTIGWILAVLGL